MNERGPNHEGLGSARLSDEQRTQLRRLVAATGFALAARTLHLGTDTLTRALDPHELLTETIVQRVVLALAHYERRGG